MNLGVAGSARRPSPARAADRRPRRRRGPAGDDRALPAAAAPPARASCRSRRSGCAASGERRTDALGAPAAATGCRCCWRWRCRSRWSCSRPSIRGRRRSTRRDAALVILIDRSASMSARDERRARASAPRAASRATLVVDGLGRARPRPGRVVRGRRHRGDAASRPTPRRPAARAIDRRRAAARSRAICRARSTSRRACCAAARGRRSCWSATARFTDERARAAAPIARPASTSASRRVGPARPQRRHRARSPRGAYPPTRRRSRRRWSSRTSATRRAPSRWRSRPARRRRRPRAPAPRPAASAGATCCPTSFAPDARLTARLLTADGRPLDAAGATISRSTIAAFAVVPALARAAACCASAARTSTSTARC